MSSKIIIGIPGKWGSRKEIIESVALKSGGYLLAGNLLSKIGYNKFFEVDIYEHDNELNGAFRISGAGIFTEEQFKEIDQHTFTVYLIGDGGSAEDVLEIMQAGCGLLKAGGLAIKVESSGVSNNPDTWFERFESKNMAEIAKSFITFVNAGKYYYSCGMHCFGHPDTITFTDQVSWEYASTLMWSFCLYCIIEKPVLKSNELFSIDSRSQCFIIEHSKCNHIEEEHPYYNPYGMWVLVKEES